MKNLNNKNLINFNLSLIDWNSNGGGLNNDKNLPKRLLLKGLCPDIIFLTEPWVEFDFKNNSYISFTEDPVNEKISSQLLVKEKFTSKKYPKCHADNVGVELILEKSIIYLIATYIHPSNKIRRKATLINQKDNLNNIKELNPDTKIIIAGDFNIDINKRDKFDESDKELIRKIIKDGNVQSNNGWTFKHKGSAPGEKESKLDFFIFITLLMIFWQKKKAFLGLCLTTNS